MRGLPAFKMSFSDAPLPPAGAIREAVRRALAEDVSTGDITTEAVVSPRARVRAAFVYREPAVVAGLPVVREVFRQLDADAGLDEAVAEGSPLAGGHTAAVVEAKARPLLTGERVALNFLQRMSGVATLTRAFVAAVEGTGTRILDTRKTTPGLRALEKYAVRVGGGINHRMGLYDTIQIKDNHIAAAGGLADALRGTARARAECATIQVEIDRLEQVEEAIRGGATWLMFDNMTPAQVRQAVALARGRVTLEVTGEVTLDSARDYAEAGVDFLSVGRLTHSARAIDIGLDVDGWT